MAWVSLVPNTVRTPADNPIQEPHFLEVIRARSQDAFYLAQEGFYHAVLSPLQIVLQTGESEVIPVDHGTDVTARVVEAAWTSFASHEAHALQLLGVVSFPPGWCIPRTVEATQESGTLSWAAVLRREVNVDLSHRLCVEVRLPDIDQEYLILSLGAPSGG